MGPVHYVVVAFDHPDFHGRLATELAALVDSGTVRLLDLVFVNKDADGQVTTVEVDGLPEEWAAYGNVEGAYGGLVSDEDLDEVADRLEPDSATRACCCGAPTTPPRRCCCGRTRGRTASCRRSQRPAASSWTRAS